MGSTPTNLSQLIATSRIKDGVWAKFNDTTFEVKVGYYGKAQMTDMVERAKVITFDTQTMRDKEDTDKERFRKEYARTVIKDWKGLTEPVLRRLIVLGDAELPPDYELPCNDENKELLIANSVEFDQWLQRVCTKVENFNTKKAAEETKN